MGRAHAFVMIALVLPLAACVEAAVDLRPIARPLGVASSDGACRFGATALTRATLARWAEAPSEARPFAAEWSCVALYENLAYDSMSDCMPKVEDAFSPELGRTRRIEGERYYVHIAPRKYAYDLTATHTLDVEVRVRFEGDLARDSGVIAAMQDKLTRAAALWTESAPSPNIRFRFRVDDKDPHFSVRLVRGAPRTPYDATWGADWGFHLIAHEVGHMMGLDDEYGQFRKTLGHALGYEPLWRKDRNVRVDWLRCDLGSLMCDSKGETSTPLGYHYYVILRRRFCQNVPLRYPTSDGM
jgi:hypothetical protein